jgi:hypothetical protein
VRSVVDVSDVLVSSAFSIEVCSVGEFMRMYELLLQGRHVGRTGIGAPFGPVETVDRENCEMVEKALPSPSF